jgi:UDP-glucose 4-epimerase
MTTKILITGAGGYIGSIATSVFLQAGYEVVAIDNFSSGFKQPLELLQKKYGSEKLRFYQLDLLTDSISDLFKKEERIEAVIHYAGSCSVDESMHNPEKYFQINAQATERLLQAMTDATIDTLIFSSSCVVHGESDGTPVTEEHALMPTSPYGESKKMAEKIITWFGSQKGIKYVILRYFNVCGAAEQGELGDSKKPSMHLMQNAVKGALGLSQFYLTCGKMDTPDQTPIRDYVDVLDVNTAHLKALEYLAQGGENNIINIGTGKGMSVLEIVKAVEKQTGVSLSTQLTTPRQGEYARMTASFDKAKKILNWNPQRTLEQSIESLIAWYKKNPQGWEY